MENAATLVLQTDGTFSHEAIHTGWRQSCLVAPKQRGSGSPGFRRCTMPPRVTYRAIQTSFVFTISSTMPARRVKNHTHQPANNHNDRYSCDLYILTISNWTWSDTHATPVIPQQCQNFTSNCSHCSTGKGEALQHSHTTAWSAKVLPVEVAWKSD